MRGTRSTLKRVKRDASARLWGSVDRLDLLLKVLIFLIEALNLILLGLKYLNKSKVVRIFNSNGAHI